MQLIHEDKKKRVIRRQEQITFSSSSSYHLIIITARAKSEKQFGKNATDDEELTVSIDGKIYPKFGTDKAILNSPAAFNGGQLHNLSKTIYFLTRLEGKDHTITLTTDDRPSTATLESIQVYTLSLDSKLTLTINKRAEDGDRRPWLTFVLDDLVLDTFRLTARTDKRYRDSDDLKIIIDGKTQTHFDPEIEVSSDPWPKQWFYRLWYFVGSLLQDQVRIASLFTKLPKGLHYIELHADRKPKVERVEFELEKTSKPALKGKVALHKDITPTDFANLRNSPDHKQDNNIITRLKHGQEVVILKEKVKGSYVSNRSNIWHKIIVNGQEGFILSSFVEITDQEREVVLNKIRQKTQELDVNADLMLALAGCESQYKPYAISEDDAKGIFQLTQIAIQQLKDVGFEIKDAFDIDQNIEGGIRYFRWLLTTYYSDAPQSIEKTIAAYNWGQSHIPSDEPLKLSSLPKATAWLIKCVTKNKNRKNWSKIILPLIVISFLGSIFQLNGFLPNLPTPTVLSQQAVQTPTYSNLGVKKDKCLSLSQIDNHKLALINSNCEEVKRFTTHSLQTANIFGLTQEELGKSWFMLHPRQNVLQHHNTFYFLVSNTNYCGAQNCSYALYKYNRETDQLGILTKDISGTGVRLFLSPNAKQLAIVSTFHSSVCYEQSSLAILDLVTKSTEDIKGILDPQLQVTYIEDLEWLSDQHIRFLTIHSAGCDPTVTLILHKEFNYNLDNGLLQWEVVEEENTASG